MNSDCLENLQNILRHSQFPIKYYQTHADSLHLDIRMRNSSKHSKTDKKSLFEIRPASCELP